MNETILNIPNALTMLRFLLIPLLVWLLSLPHAWAPWACITTGAIMAVTDVLDGYLGRKLGQVTDVGTALDPIVDKILGVSLAIGLYHYRALPVEFVLFLVAKELLLTLKGIIALKLWTTIPSANLWGKAGFVALMTTMVTYVLDVLPEKRVWMLWIVVTLQTIALVSYYIELIRGEKAYRHHYPKDKA